MICRELDTFGMVYPFEIITLTCIFVSYNLSRPSTEKLNFLNSTREHDFSMFCHLLQEAFVLCRLFRKSIETLGSPNCDDGEGAPSTPAAKSSPEDTESDLVTGQESPPSLKMDGHTQCEDEAQQVRNKRLSLSFYIHL